MAGKTSVMTGSLATAVTLHRGILSTKTYSPEKEQQEDSPEVLMPMLQGSWGGAVDAAWHEIPAYRSNRKTVKSVRCM